MADDTQRKADLELFDSEIEAAAERYDIPESQLLDTLEQVDEMLAQDSMALHDFYVEEHGDEYSEPEIIVDGGHFEVLYIYPEDWNDFQSDLGLSDDEKMAASKAHNDTAQRMGADENVLGTMGALVMPHPIVSRLLSAGLSRRQAEVQALRMDGATQERISDELGMALGTVKSHCRRVDEKIEQAEDLMEILESYKSDG